METLGTVVIIVGSGLPAIAHKVKADSDVGATLHIEPNDNPRAGEPSKTWFALTQRGGKTIPLSECNCQLAVFAKPRKAGDAPLFQPALQAVTAERYQGIPGTFITFPQPGAYQLHLSGKPANGERFKPFELDFDVTVAAGSTQPQQTPISQNVQAVQNAGETPPKATFSPIYAAIAIPVIIAIAVVVSLAKRKS